MYWICITDINQLYWHFEDGLPCSLLLGACTHQLHSCTNSILTKECNMLCVLSLYLSPWYISLKCNTLSSVLAELHSPNKKTLRTNLMWWEITMQTYFAIISNEVFINFSISLFNYSLYSDVSSVRGLRVNFSSTGRSGVTKHMISSQLWWEQ